MRLQFTVEIEVSQYGKEWVPYLRNLLSQTLSRVGKTFIVFNGEDSDITDVQKAYEYEMWKQGHVDL